MYDIYITYKDKQDREFLERVKTEIPAYLHFYNMLSSEEIKEGRKIKNYGAARKDPFVMVKEGEEVKQVFYSETGDAINKLILFLNGKA